jgi:hypothetical protein
MAPKGLRQWMTQMAITRWPEMGEFNDHMVHNL